jgi:hypothetical protein
MKTQKQQLQEKITILIDNIKTKLEETQELVNIGGSEKHNIKGHNISLNDMFDFSKMDIEGFIAYLFMTKQNKEVFGELSFPMVQVIFCCDTPVVSKKVMNALVKLYLK